MKTLRRLTLLYTFAFAILQLLLLGTIDKLSAQEVVFSTTEPQPKTCSGGKLWYDNSHNILWACTVNNTWVMYTAGGGNSMVFGPGSTFSGYVPLWNNTTGTQLAGGLPVSTTAAVNTIPQSNNLSVLSPTWIPAFSGDITTSNGSTSAQVTALHLLSPVPVLQGGSGVTTITGLVLGNGQSPFTAAASSNVVGLFSGTCSSSTYLRGDGSCAAPSGSGTVTNAAPLTLGQLVFGNGSASLTVGNLSGDVTTSNSSVVTVSKINGTALSGLATGLLKNTTTTGVPSIAVASDITGLFSGTCSSSNFLRGDGSCTVTPGTVSNSGTLNSNQLLVGGGTTVATTGNLTGDAITLGTTATTVSGINGVLLSSLSTGLIKITLGIPSIAASADITSLWSGTCNSGSYLRGDGNCSLPPGTVTNSGTLTSGQLLFGGGTTVVTAGDLTGDATTTGTSAVTVKKLNGVSLAGLATGLLKNTTTTGAPSIAAVTDVTGLFSGTCTSSNFLRGDGSCAAPVGSGTATAIQNSSSLPGTCNVGDVYFLTSGVQSGRNQYVCVSSNTWVQANGGATSLTPSSSGALAPSPNIDPYAIVNVATTTAGLDFTLPNPSTTTVGQRVVIVNNGSVATPAYSFSLGGSNIQPGTAITAVWNPTSAQWQFENLPTPGQAYYIVGLGCKSQNHTDTNCISTITQAYNDALAAGLSSVKIVDYTLTYSAATTEILTNTPWTTNGGEMPVDLTLGPGILIMKGPFTVGRNSHVIGFGRTSSTTNIGTVIQASTTGCNGNKDSASCQYGGIYTVTVTGGTTCTVGDKFNVIDGAGNGSGALLQVATISGGNPTSWKLLNLGGGYGAATSLSLTANGSTGCTGGSLTVTAFNRHLYGAFLGDQYTSTSNTFGQRLMRLTLDGNDVNCYSGIEVQNAQEQSTLDELNIFRWGGYACPSDLVGGVPKGVWIHGGGSNNFTPGNLEVNGCASGDTLCKVSYNNKEYAVENTYIGVLQKITHNPVNVVVSPNITNATCTGTSPAIVTLTFTSTLQPQFGPVGGPYAGGISVTGMTPTGYNGLFAINSIPSGTTLTYPLNNGVACPASFVSGGAAAIMPAYGIWGCSGASGCDDNAAPISDVQTPTNFILTAAHCEHTDTCLAVTGTRTTVTDIGSVSTVGSTSRIGTHIIGACGSNPSSYTAWNLSTNGNITTNQAILDDCAPAISGTQIATRQDSIVPYYHTGANSDFSGGLNTQSTTYQIIGSDCGKLLDFTGSSSTSWTLTKINLNATNTMGYGCQVLLQNTGSGSLTLNAGSGNTIDGASSLPFGPGTQGAVRSDGSATWHVVYNTASTSGTVTHNTGNLTTNVIVTGTNSTGDIQTAANNPTVDSSGNVGVVGTLTVPSGFSSGTSAAFLINGGEAVASTPASGQDALYFDPTSHVLTEKNSAGAVFAVAVQPGQNCSGTQVANGYLASGLPNCVNQSGGSGITNMEFNIGGCGNSGNYTFLSWSFTPSSGVQGGCAGTGQLWPFVNFTTTETGLAYSQFTMPTNVTNVDAVLSGFSSVNGGSSADTVKFNVSVACYASGAAYLAWPTFTSVASNTVIINHSTGSNTEAGMVVTGVPVNGCTANQHAVLSIKRVSVTSDLSGTYNLSDVALKFTRTLP